METEENAFDAFAVPEHEEVRHAGHRAREELL
jgi:hypothetical protein